MKTKKLPTPSESEQDDFEDDEGLEDDLEYDDEEDIEESMEDEGEQSQEASEEKEESEVDKAEATVMDSGLLQAILTKETPEVEQLLLDFQPVLT